MHRSWRRPFCFPRTKYFRFTVMLLSFILTCGCTLVHETSEANLPSPLPVETNLLQNTPVETPCPNHQQNTQASTVPASLPMYEAVLSAFFKDPYTQSFFLAPQFPLESVFIQPINVTQLPDTLVDEITTRIETYLQPYPIPLSKAEQPNQLIVTFAAPEQRADTPIHSCQPGPTIFMSVAVRGQEERTWQSRGYIVTTTDRGWQATLYVSGIS